MGTDENLTRVRFGGFELQPGERRLLVDGQLAAVGPRAFDVLMVLVERAGKLVTKNELLDRVWPNLVVEENNLQVQVSALRKILGPDAIATVPGHGYRFTLDLVRDEAAPSMQAEAPGVRDHAFDKLILSLEDSGARRNNNIVHSADPEGIPLGGQASTSSSRRRWNGFPRSLGRRWFGAGVAAIAIATVAFLTLLPLRKPAIVTKPEPMSVVVVPLAAEGSEGDAMRLAEALTRDLVSRLGRVNGTAGRLHVVKSRRPDSVNDVTPSEIGRPSGPRYVVEGAVLRSGSANTVDLRLVDAVTRRQIWSERETLQESDLSDESSSKMRGFVKRMRIAIVAGEMRRVSAEALSGLSAAELVLRAMAQPNNVPALAGTLEMRKLLDQALRLDPNLVTALTLRASLTEEEYYTDPDADRSRLARELDEDTRRAVEIDPTNAMAWGWRSVALGYLGRWDAALEANSKAIKLDPDEPEVYRWRAELMNEMGRPAEALPLIDRALEMDPASVDLTILTACLSHLLLGQSETAVSTCERASALNDWWEPRLWLVAAYGNHGDIEKATVAKAELLRSVPGYTIARARAADQHWGHDYSKLAEAHIYEGLRKAGIPEQ